MQRRLPIAIAAALAVAAAALARSPDVDPDAAASVDPDAIAPITYFNANCASCHGDYGSFWGDGFAADYGRDELHEIVDEMCAGPAFAPLDGDALDVQTAYNFSRSAAGSAQGPFLVVAPGGTGGEVTPGSTVTVEHGGEQEAAFVDGHRWTVDLDPGAVTRVVATLDGKMQAVTPDAARAAWSHRADAPTTRPDD